ncbi:MAG: amidohydrolase, partial [Bryobacteraceae bacterium]|nr:amidohydrolase [Bryobacteraceae bacterium]
KPTGVLKEGAMYLVSRHVPKATVEAKLGALTRGLKIAASMGITSIQNASRGQDEVELYATLLKQGQLTVRTSLALDGGAKMDLAKYDLIRKKYQSPMLAARAIKFFLDGVIETKTAAMLEPYEGETNGGTLNMTEKDYEWAVKKADAAGWQIYTHAIGDRAVRVALDQYDAAMKWNKTQGARHRIEHIEVLHPEDLPRFAKLGVLPVMQPIHAYPSTVAVWEKLVGEKRKKLAFPWASLAGTGAHLTFSSDWPACISMDPIRGIHNAVNRMTIEGTPAGGWVPAQRVTLEQALRFYTAGGAYASFEEKIKGKLVVGQLADIAVLDQDPFQVAAKDLHKLKVEMTIVDGKVVYGNQ